ncbi:flagellar basal body-associated protein FliL [Pallidibacillus thermolactis]|jgi:flagellar protein FliL|uniref:flagellar basal body-associated protein FliL n=1 Tax=Pallidibacillus thermolactis TaxID=251051 RepID=UPI00156ABD43|nr:flagellar basal body-associated protein FliL [Pallidibacillus thermolactis]MCU9600151.1 flagellar basal body-associated protein FliL [Pallidibacillus thermolactis subsp. kokeshiiformis]MED1672014.1 flagellar basal body-associated protein FliL [Pallidibacillus thermolactis subsp. kokeshiiformis]
MKNGVKLLIISMLIVIIILAAGLYLFCQKTVEGTENESSVDEIIANSVEIPELTTNLASDHFIRIAFTIQTDSKKTKQQLEKRNFQVNNTIIKQLSGMQAEEIKGTEGKIQLEETLKSSLNSLLEEGEVEQVYITTAIIQ